MDGRTDPQNKDEIGNGKKYEFGLLMTILINGQDLPEFKVGKEISIAGEFDDLAIQYNDKNNKEQNIFMQLKLLDCKRNITEDVLLGKKSISRCEKDFYIIKYFNSYLRLKNQYENTNRYFERLIIFTNAESIDKHVGTKKINRKNSEFYNLLEINQDSETYKINKTKNIELALRECGTDIHQLVVCLEEKKMSNVLHYYQTALIDEQVLKADDKKKSKFIFHPNFINSTNLSPNAQLLRNQIFLQNEETMSHWEMTFSHFYGTKKIGVSEINKIANCLETVIFEHLTEIPIYKYNSTFLSFYYKELIRDDILEKPETDTNRIRVKFSPNFINDTFKESRKKNNSELVKEKLKEKLSNRLNGDELEKKLQNITFEIAVNEIDKNSILQPIKLPSYENIKKKDIKDFLNIFELKIKQPDVEGLNKILTDPDMHNHVRNYTDSLSDQIWKWKNEEQQKEKWLSSKIGIIKFIQDKMIDMEIRRKLGINKKAFKRNKKMLKFKFNGPEITLNENNRRFFETEQPTLVNILLYHTHVFKNCNFVRFDEFECDELEPLLKICNVEKNPVTIVTITKTENNLDWFLNRLKGNVILVNSSQMPNYKGEIISPKIETCENILEVKLKFRNKEILFQNLVCKQFEFDNKFFEELLVRENIEIDNKFNEVTNYLERTFTNSIGEIINEENLLNNKNNNEKILIISGNVGIGKSTLLSHFAYKLSQNNKSDWILKINLADLASVFQSSEGIKMSRELSRKDYENEQNKQLVTRVFLNCLNEQHFEKSLIKHALTKKGNIFILLDGLDEVPSSYNVVKFVKVLSMNKIKKLILSSRPITVTKKQGNKDETTKNTSQIARKAVRTLVEVLKDKLESSIYVLNELSEAQQKKLLEINKQCQIDSLRKRVNTQLLELTGNPLHLTIMAEACSPTDETAILINQLELYENFMAKKFDTHFESKCKLVDVPRFNKQLYDMLLEQTYELYENLSFLTTFDEVTLRNLGFTKILQEKKEHFKNFKDQIKNIGITKESEADTPYFLHKSFADFFLAKRLYKFLINTTELKNNNLYEYFISDILTEAIYEDVCSFLNSHFGRLTELPMHDINLESTNTTALLVAAKRGHDKIAEYLLVNGANPNIIDMYFQTPLHNAVRRGLNSTVKLLIKYKADINFRNNLNLTPMQEAVLKNDTSIVRSLLVADTNFFEEPLFDAVEKNDVEAVKVILTDNPNVNQTDDTNSSLLHYTALNANEEIAEQLLKKGADINHLNENKETALHWATITDKTTMISLLLKKAADVNCKDNLGCTALHWASLRGNIEIVQMILSYINQENDDINIQDNKGITAINYAVRSGKVEVVEKLLQMKNIDCNIPNADGNAALHIAVIEGYEEIVKTLLRHNANIHLLNKSNLSPLHWALRKNMSSIIKSLLTFGEKEIPSELHSAALEGNIEDVREILQQNASTNSANLSHETALHWAVAGGHLAIVELLIENGANVTAEDKLLCTPIHWASMTQHLDILRTLLKNLSKHRKIDICNRTNETALHFATRNGNLEIVEELLKAKANCNALNSKGFSPLHIAVEENYESTVALLIKYKADITLKDKEMYSPMHRAVLWDRKSILKYFLIYEPNNKMSPLHEACAAGDYTLAEELLKENPNPNVLDSKNSTPLHYAALNGYVKTMKVLLKYDAWVNLKNKNKQTPYHWAVILDQKKCAKLLKKEVDKDNWKDIFSYTAEEWYRFRKTGKIDNEHKQNM